MATIAIFGGTGYAGGAIKDEALRRGHTVISISRREDEVAGQAALITRAGNLHDPALVDHMAVEADVPRAAIRASAEDDSASPTRSRCWPKCQPSTAPGSG